MIKIKYNSPAIPQGDYNFSVGLVYNCEQVEKTNNYMIKCGKFEKEYPSEFIKKIFEPCNGYSWEMLDNKDVSKDSEKKNTSKDSKKGAKLIGSDDSTQNK